MSFSDVAKEVLERVRAMTPEEFRESLIRAGIIDTDGNLTPHYQSK